MEPLLGLEGWRRGARRGLRADRGNTCWVRAAWVVRAGLAWGCRPGTQLSGGGRVHGWRTLQRQAFKTFCRMHMVGKKSSKTTDSPVAMSEYGAFGY